MPEPRALIESICEENRKFYSDRRGIGALKDLQQTFPNPWLYVAELLQNAVDAAATRIALTLAKDQNVIFEHNGEEFSPADVEALCSRGVSAKGANTVGFMGVGFKSVFRSFEEAQVSSDQWRFVLRVAATEGEQYGDQQRDWLGAVLPSWNGSAEAPSPGMKCRFVLSKRLPHLPSPTEDLDHVLGEGQTLLALLAWQSVEELQWNGKLWLLKRDESPLNDTGDRRVMLEATHDAGEPFRRWVLFSKKYQPSRQAIARFLEHRQLVPAAEEKERVYREASQRRQVAVFCEIDGQGNPTTPDRGSAFALLPTGVTFPLGLHVQADWLLVVTRREIMQLEGNEWHEEILKQLPSLIRYYLEWLVGGRDRSSGEWHRGYDAMPSPPMHDVHSDAWFGSRDFVNALREELTHVLFVPKPMDADGSVAFLSPSRGRFLAKPFAREFEDPKTRPDVLFGDRVVDAHVLGTRASHCLQRLQLVNEFTAADLVAYWKPGLGEWIELFPEELRNKMLVRILQALADLDEIDAWRDAELVCLPTAAGGWIHRSAASRYPGDWNVLAQENDIRGALDQLLGVPQSIVAWDFDSMLQQTRSSAKAYLDRVPQPKLEEIVDKWWEKMPEAPTPEEVSLIVRLTAWVLEKQPQRRSLVKKLLCLEIKENGARLHPTAETLLAEPYAGAFRRLFFPNAPAVAPVYVDQSFISTRADWRAFFEKLDPPLKGKTPLILKGEELFGGELSKLVGENYKPPYHRSGWMVLDWRGFKVHNDRYTVVDTCFAAPVLDSLTISLRPEQFYGISEWLEESPNLLREYASVLVAYIAYMSNYVQTASVPRRASWVASLDDNRWIYTKNGDGPFRPSEVLAAPDPLRPDAPIADMSAELVGSLHECGVRFGVGLPDAPALDRLRIQGPTAAEEQLLGLLEKAITEADDESKKDYLRNILSERPLFPFPLDRATPDRVMRVSHSRLVWSDRTRSALGNWLLPVEYYPEGTLNRQILELLDSFLSIPRTTTLTQVLNFLSWVWATRPDANLVRQVLPRAYGYVREDLQADSSLLNAWNECIEGASVFLLGKRQWTPVAGSDMLFLDDLNESGLIDLAPTLELATPGHFGETLADQVSTANLLGVRLLSSRFRVKVEASGMQPVPYHWQKGFSAIQNWLRAQVAKSDDDAERSTSTMHIPQLKRWNKLQTVVYDNGAPVQASQVRAASWETGNIAVAGVPDDFAEELCKILFTQWGLRLRRDLVELIPKVAIQLTKIDDRAAVQQWLSGQVPAQPVVPQSGGEGAEPTQAPESTSELSNSERQPPGAVELEAPSEINAAEIAREQPPGVVEAGGSYTEITRESRIRSWIDKKHELDEKIHAALTLDVMPAEPIEPVEHHPGHFRSDDVYREAALRYEIDQDRHPHAKAATQPGHDIDSYSHPEGDPERKLVRRIEVKGRSTPWDLDEIVEMSAIQFKDALDMSVPPQIATAPEFDYWLYVVERREDGELRVVPIRNVAREAAHFALKGGSWRYLAESGAGQDSERPQTGLAVGAVSSE